MKRRMTWTLAAMLTYAITLGGCGGGSTPQEPTAQEDAVVAEQDAANPDEQTERANPAEKFVGSWKFAYLQEDGVTVIGNPEFLEETFGQTIDISVTFEEAGTGTITLGNETHDITWEVDDAGDSVLVLTDDENTVPSTFKYENGELHTSTNDTTGVMTLTPDGKSEKVKAVSLADAVDITSADELVGEWKLTGQLVGGLFITGETDKLLEYTNEGFASASFKDDGTCTLLGYDVTYSVGENGATIDTKGGAIPVKTMEGDLIIDLAPHLGRCKRHGGLPALLQGIRLTTFAHVGHAGILVRPRRQRTSMPRIHAVQRLPAPPSEVRCRRTPGGGGWHALPSTNARRAISQELMAET